MAGFERGVRPIGDWSMSITLSSVVDALDGVVRAGRVVGAVELLRQPLVQDLVDQRAFAGAGDAGDGDELAERKRDVDILEVVLARATHHERASVARRGAAPAWGSRACRRDTGR